MARATQRNGRGPVRATVFPNGCALGATWSTETLHEVGRVLGTEARGVHNGITDSQRSVECNGCGITLYAPNLNLVRDPRCASPPDKSPRLSAETFRRGLQGAVRRKRTEKTRCI